MASNFEFYSPTRVIFGKGTEQRVGALVREYGDMQGFAVSVESELGRGSRFVITIPASAIVGEIEGEDDV